MERFCDKIISSSSFVQLPCKSDLFSEDPIWRPPNSFSLPRLQQRFLYPKLKGPLGETERISESNENGAMPTVHHTPSCRGAY